MSRPDRIGAKALLPVTLVGDTDAAGRCIVQLDCGKLRFEVPFAALLPADQASTHPDGESRLPETSEPSGR